MRRPPFSHSDSPNSVISIQQQQQRQRQRQQQPRQTGIPSRSPPPVPPMQRSNSRRQLNLNGQRTTPIPPSRKPSVMEGDADRQPFRRHESDSALVFPKRTSTTTLTTPFSRVSLGKNNSKADATSPKSSKPSYRRRSVLPLDPPDDRIHPH